MFAIRSYSRIARYSKKPPQNITAEILVAVITGDYLAVSLRAQHHVVNLIRRGLT